MAELEAALWVAVLSVMCAVLYECLLLHFMFEAQQITAQLVVHAGMWFCCGIDFESTLHC
jgi:hypothetical protein